ncbi:probable root meristem growth factor 8 [Herrania umbratica]|uniref:Probable root meristem growth factor 8 n=1 Tax=Herrania umbratica TaxID=108875 RepID=A0A6J1B2H3_9ROSI|nr:probable root meristem growth factor 8 [Herrania umbratica]
MELSVVIAVLCFSFLALQTPCTSLQIQLQSSTEQGAAKGVQLSLPTLPRKLRFTEELVAFKGNGAQHSISNTKQKEDISGKAYQKEEARVHGSRGTRQEWVEGPDVSQYFTMDYSNVRRRRPIHNKSLPVGP